MPRADVCPQHVRSRVPSGLSTFGRSIVDGISAVAPMKRALSMPPCQAG